VAANCLSWEVAELEPRGELGAPRVEHGVDVLDAGMCPVNDAAEGPLAVGQAEDPIGCWRRPAITTRFPAAANRLAKPRPMPDVAPVMKMPEMFMTAPLVVVALSGGLQDRLGRVNQPKHGGR
jgi:hypothetical protein